MKSTQSEQHSANSPVLLRHSIVNSLFALLLIRQGLFDLITTPVNTHVESLHFKLPVQSVSLVITNVGAVQG